VGDEEETSTWFYDLVVSLMMLVGSVGVQRFAWFIEFDLIRKAGTGLTVFSSLSTYILHT
jgi:hypothetical protein